VRRVGELQISDVGRLFGIAPHVLRHWEAVGVLIPPIRRQGRRFYHEPHVKRVAMIICGQRAALGLTELREIIEAPTVPARRSKLRQHQATLARRISDLEESQRIVAQMLNWSREDFSECPVFRRPLATTESAGAAAPQLPRRRAIGHGTKRQGGRQRA
jgi:MerR family transcriptional regulator, copper efflux regulator